MAIAKNEQIAEVTTDKDGGVQPQMRRGTVGVVLTFELQECFNHDWTNERRRSTADETG